jgi:hypothetical protein
VLCRALIFLAGMTGLLAMFGVSAGEFIGHQHCEPLVR